VPLSGGGAGPYLIQCGLGRDLPPYQVASWSIQPFGHNRHQPKMGGCAPFGEGELGPHLTQCGRGQGLPPCPVSSWSVQPFGHNTPTFTDRTDRQRSNSIGQTVLQTVAQKAVSCAWKILRWLWTAGKSLKKVSWNIIFHSSAQRCICTMDGSAPN